MNDIYENLMVEKSIQTGTLLFRVGEDSLIAYDSVDDEMLDRFEDQEFPSGILFLQDDDWPMTYQVSAPADMEEEFKAACLWLLEEAKSIGLELEYVY